MSAEPAPFHPLLRPLSSGDLDRAMEIELSAYPFPWTRGIFNDCLRVGYDCWGLQLGSRLAGYSVQADAAGESHLLNLCVDPAWQRRGLGRMLLENAVRIARAHRCASMYLEVRPSNPAGVALYAAQGFAVIGRRPDYYSARTADGEGREDALVMRLPL
ncbi:MAG: ribosomal protein S18-alanine N-acetyltransferase [Lysobacterales bacterium]